MRALVTVKHWPSQRKHKWVAVYRQGGKRQARYFPQEKAAKAFAAEKGIELLNEGRKHGAVTDAERRAIFAAREAGVGVGEAVTFYVEHRAALGRSLPCSTAVGEFLSIRTAEHKSAAHLKDLRLCLAAFTAALPAGRLAAAVTTREIDVWLTGLPCGPQTRGHYRAAVHNFFAWAVARGYAPANPAAGAARVKVQAPPPGILSVQQAQALLAACAPACLPAVACGLFAGLRSAEIARLGWHNLDTARRFIEVTAVAAKTAQRRLVAVSDNLAAWLAPHVRQAGAVRPPFGTFRRLFREARTAAGIAPWPPNALRHSFASYHLAFHRDAARTALELGHINSALLFRHYRELVRPEAAEAFWQIFP